MRYFTSNQNTTRDALGLDRNDSVYPLKAAMGLRLRAALGHDIADRNHGCGARPITYRLAICEYLVNLDTTLAFSDEGRSIRVTRMLSQSDERYRHEGGVGGICYSMMSEYDFAYANWGNPKDTYRGTHRYHPDLWEDDQWAIWASLLPAPWSLWHGAGVCTLEWAPGVLQPYSNVDPFRVTPAVRRVTASHCSWRMARAEALLLAFESMPPLPDEAIVAQLDEDQTLDAGWLAVHGGPVYMTAGEYRRRKA